MSEKEKPIGTSINPNTLDFNYLRQQGIQHLERLAGQLWTDYNTHDPGITILEYLCFSLVDLNYRTTLPVEDVTTDPLGKLPSPGEALHCNPVTESDLRKLVLDIEEVKNVLVVPANSVAPHIYINRKRNTLTHTPPHHEDREQDRLSIRGRYKVLLEMESDKELGDLNDNKITRKIRENLTIEVEFPHWDNAAVDWTDGQSILTHIDAATIYLEEAAKTHKTWEEIPALYRDSILTEKENGLTMVAAYQEKVIKCHKIRRKVAEKLHACRSLCEDFAAIEAVRIEEIGLSVDIEVSGETNMQALLGEIFYQVDRFLSPPVVFHKALDLLEQGMPIDRIFQGPFLKHGVLLDRDLPVHREAIYISDIIHIIMECEGVKAVKRLVMANYRHGALVSGGNRWCVRLNVDEHYIPRLSRDKCRVTFYKNGFPFTIPLESIGSTYLARRAAHRKWSHSTEEATTIPYPEGRKRSLSAYATLQNDFPLNYGIGYEGLPSGATTLRKAQANQLKAYLIFFEQLMANFLSQLEHVKELLRMGEGSGKSLFYQLLDQVPGMADLYDKDDIEGQMQEDSRVYYRRKNRFVNHLLARLGLEVEDHVMLTSGMHGDKNEEDKLKDKFHILGQGSSMNANRATAYNYTDNKAVWDTENVSGYKKRLCAFLGIEHCKRRSLANLSKEQKHEGFHLLEHILLVPRHRLGRQNQPLPLLFPEVFTDGRCPDIPWEEDPYSAIVTLVLPDWIGRFTKQLFRSYFERAAQLESPAHISVRFFWLDTSRMAIFEAAYEAWVRTLADPAASPEQLGDTRNTLIDVLNTMYRQQTVATPVNPIEDADRYAHLGVHPDWEVPALDIDDHCWIIYKDNTILQNGYAGHCNMASVGEGTVALYHQPLDKQSEVLEMMLTADNHLYSEAGLVFLWVSREDYWLLFYRNFHRTVVVAHVIKGKAQIVIENPIADLKGQSIGFRLDKDRGRIRLSQSSPNTLGSEFLLNVREDSIVNTRFGLYTRYSNHTRFMRMRLIDHEENLIIPLKGTGGLTANTQPGQPKNEK